MIITSINHSHSFTAKPSSEAKRHSRNQLLKYGALGAVGCAGGYHIPLKEIDGPDVVSSVSGNKLVMMKTKVPNEIGKYKNAGWGILAGLAAAVISDFIFNR